MLKVTIKWLLITASIMAYYAYGAAMFNLVESQSNQPSLISPTIEQYIENRAETIVISNDSPTEDNLNKVIADMESRGYSFHSVISDKNSVKLVFKYNVSPQG